MSKDLDQRAYDLHRKAIVINPLDSTGISALTPGYLTKLARGGVTAFCSSDDVREFLTAVMRISKSYGVLETNGSKLMHIRSAEDIREAKLKNLTGMILGLQDTPIDGNLAFLKILHRLGVRVIQVTYQRRNLLGDGCGERTDAGLSKFGVQAVEEMNKLGLLIDLSHVGMATTLDTIRMSKDPVAFTHTCVRSLCNHVRNKSDEEIKAMAEKGGVMGIAYLSHMIRPDGNIKGTSVEDYLDHVDYVAKMVGVDHVGIGLDYKDDRKKESWDRLPNVYPELAVKGPYDFSNATVKELRDIGNLTEITKGLLTRGYSDQDIEKILGKNFLNLFERVWRN